MVSEVGLILLPETVALVREAEQLNLHGLSFQNICLCPLRCWLHYQRVDCAHLNRHMRRGSAEQVAHYQGTVAALQGVGIVPDMLDVEEHVVSEVKSRKSFPHASKAQLLFYMAVLSVSTGQIWSGRLRYPSRRRVETLQLGETEQRWLAGLLADIRQIVSRPLPPPRVKKVICRDCSYRILCWQQSTDDEDFG